MEWHAMEKYYVFAKMYPNKEYRRIARSFPTQEEAISYVEKRIEQEDPSSDAIEHIRDSLSTSPDVRATLAHSLAGDYSTRFKVVREMPDGRLEPIDIPNDHAVAKPKPLPALPRPPVNYYEAKMGQHMTIIDLIEDQSEWAIVHVVHDKEWEVWVNGRLRGIHKSIHQAEAEMHIFFRSEYELGRARR
jgi:hypothetical protein